MELFGLASAAGAGAARPGRGQRSRCSRSTCSRSSSRRANFVVFLVLMWTFAFKPVAKMLGERRERIEQGLKDAEQARKDRENAEQERLAAITEARREANDILARAQKVAQETRDADIAATRDGARADARPRVRARSPRRSSAPSPSCAARSPTSPSQAAGRVVRETMTDQRQRRLVEEFLAEPARARRPRGDRLMAGRGSDRRPALCRGGVPARHARQGARRLRATGWTSPPRMLGGRRGPGRSCGNPARPLADRAGVRRRHARRAACPSRAQARRPARGARQGRPPRRTSPPSTTASSNRERGIVEAVATDAPRR